MHFFFVRISVESELSEIHSVAHQPSCVCTYGSSRRRYHQSCSTVPTMLIIYYYY